MNMMIKNNGTNFKVSAIIFRNIKTIQIILNDFIICDILCRE